MREWYMPWTAAAMIEVNVTVLAIWKLHCTNKCTNRHARQHETRLVQLLDQPCDTAGLPTNFKAMHDACVSAYVCVTRR